MPQIKLDSTRLNEVLLDDLFGFFEGNIYSMYKTLSNFVLDDQGQYMTSEAGQKFLRKTYTVKQITEAGGAFLKATQDQAVPPSTGGD